ncbi:hypothetical protein [Wolbachia endosymbiont (group E) of Neria commutata]
MLPNCRYIIAVVNIATPIASHTFLFGLKKAVVANSKINKRPAARQEKRG